MRRLLVLLFTLLAGCSTGTLINPPIEPPELVSLVPLPPYRSATFQSRIKLDLMILIGKDGSVGDVQLVNSTGNPEWDTLALRSVRRWRFTSPRKNGEPTELWIRQAVTVEFQDPLMMVLAVLTVNDQQTADSLYLALDRGADFVLTASRVVSEPAGQRNGLLGTVDVTQYPPRVRDAVSKLRIGEYTHPLRVGDRFVIYKRLPKEAS